MPTIPSQARPAPSTAAAPGAPSSWSKTPLALLTAIFFCNFLARIILSPLMPTVEADLGLGHGEAGSLFLATAAGYMLALLASPLVSSRFHHRAVIIGSTVCVAFALGAASLSAGPASLRASLLAVGMGAGFYLPSGLATLTASVPKSQWGRAIGVHEVAPNSAFILAPVVAELLLRGATWRGGLRAVAAAILVAGALFAWRCPQGNFRGKPPQSAALKRLGRDPDFWRMSLLFSLGITGTLGVYAMLPLFLVSEHGFSQAGANLLFAASRVSTLATALLGGWATDRFGVRRTMGTALAAAGICTVLLGVAPRWAVPVLLFLQPVLAVAFFPAGFASLAGIGPPESRSLVVAFTVPLAFLLGGGGAPLLVGWMGERGRLGLGLSLAGALIALGALLVRGLRPQRAGRKS
jgi:NNP family nitrate/nitrite transporter-like MFS transporter